MSFNREGLVALLISAFLVACFVSQGKDVIHIPFRENESSTAGEKRSEVGVDGKLVNFDRMLNFLPYKETDCNKVFKGRASFNFPSKYLTEEKLFTEHLQSLNAQEIEGHSQEFQGEQKAYWKIASLPFVHTICETGFNAGHSTLIWLMVKEDTKVYSFDLGVHEYGRPMAEYLQKRFPGRLLVTWGDSMHTLPKFLRDNGSLKCDFLIVDGGHTEAIASADLANFREMANELNLVIIDDYPTNMGVNKYLAPAWEKMKRNKILTELFHCKSGKHRGYSIGHYMFN